MATVHLLSPQTSNKSSFLTNLAILGLGFFLFPFITQSVGNGERSRWAAIFGEMRDALRDAGTQLRRRLSLRKHSCPASWRPTKRFLKTRSLGQGLSISSTTFLMRRCLKWFIKQRPNLLLTQWEASGNKVNSEAMCDDLQHCLPVS